MDGIVERKLIWNEVLGRTYSLYAEHFATFLKIAFLPAVIAWVWRYGYAAAFRQAVASGWLDRRNFPTMTALGLMQGSVYWIISAFFLAAVAAQVLCEPGDQSSLSDAFTAARDRMGAVLGVTLLTWLLYYVGRTISAIAIAELFRGSVLFRNYWATTITFSIPLLLIAGLLSRFGLAIPALMTQPELRVTQALKESMALTESWEPFFMMFLAKSAVLAYAGYWAANFLLDQFWTRGLLTRATYPWAQSMLYIAIAMVVETPLFISFCVLYGDQQETEESALSAPAIG